MLHVAESIREAIAHQSEGAPVLAKQFFHLSSRAAVDQALSRLCRSGELMRAGRGVYVRPVTSRFGVRPPAPEKIVEALAGLKGETVAPSGASAANALGLTTQVPARMVYLTTGPARLLKVGRQEVELRHAPAWQLRWPRERAGQVVRALAWLGPEEAPQHVPALRKKLSPPERKQLAAATAGVPSWLAAHLSALAYG